MQDTPHHNLGDMEEILSKESLKEKVAAIGNTLGAGATGQFPKGKLIESDEGELRIIIGSLRGTVILAFGTAITWIGLPPYQARELADKIRDKAWAALSGKDDQDPRISA